MGYDRQFEGVWVSPLNRTRKCLPVAEDVVKRKGEILKRAGICGSLADDKADKLLFSFSVLLLHNLRRGTVPLFFGLQQVQVGSNCERVGVLCRNFNIVFIIIPSCKGRKYSSSAIHDVQFHIHFNAPQNTTASYISAIHDNI